MSEIFFQHPLLTKHLLPACQIHQGCQSCKETFKKATAIKKKQKKVRKETYSFYIYVSSSIELLENSQMHYLKWYQIHNEQVLICFCITVYSHGSVNKITQSMRQTEFLSSNCNEIPQSFFHYLR